MSSEDNQDASFRDQLEAMTRVALDEEWSVDVYIVQLKSLKYSMDKTFGECSGVVVPILLETLPKGVTQKETLKSFHTLVTKWRNLLKLFFPPDGHPDFLLLIEDFCRTPNGKDLFSIINHVLTYLYEQDLVEEKAFNEWGEYLEKRESEEMDGFFKRVSPFLEWLRREDDSEDETSQ